MCSVIAIHKRAMRSLQWRLSTGLIVSLVLLFIAMAISFDYSSRYLVQGFVSTRLDHDAEVLLAELKRNTLGQPVIRPHDAPPIYARPLSGHYYRVDLAEHVLQSPSQDGRDFLVRSPPGKDGLLAELAGPDGQQLLVLYREFDWQGQRLNMRVAEDISPYKQAREQFAVAFLWVSVTALFSLLLVQAWIVHHGLRPLVTTRRELRALQHGELEWLSLDVPEEVRPVVAEVNGLLSALNRRLVRSRKALGNLTHALKTPLTLLGELAERPPPLTAEEIQAELRQQVEAMRLLMERELRRARLAGNIGAGQVFVADEEIPPLIDALQRMHHDKGVIITLRMPAGLRCAVERQDLLELLGNLLDNACKWSHGQVQLTLQHDGGLALTVEDNGPGMSPEPGAGLGSDPTRRGARLDEQLPGHGLGLGIVQDIVDGYDGSIAFGRSADLGGLMVQVQLRGPQQG
jgi:signal transduction histidine kinase